MPDIGPIFAGLGWPGAPVQRGPLPSPPVVWPNMPPDLTGIGFGASLIYNNIPLQICRTNSFESEAVYSEDGADYLYTHFVLDLQCVFNPYATSVSELGSLQGNN